MVELYTIIQCMTTKFKAVFVPKTIILTRKIVALYKQT